MKGKATERDRERQTDCHRGAREGEPDWEKEGREGERDREGENKNESSICWFIEARSLELLELPLGWRGPALGPFSTALLVILAGR